MSSFNKFQIIGTLVKDVAVKTTKAGKSYAAIVVSVKAGANETEVISSVVFEKPAETYAKYLRKGMLVMVEGSAKAVIYNKDNNVEARLTVNNPSVTLLSREETNAENSSMHDGIKMSAPNMNNETNYDVVPQPQKLEEWSTPEGLPF